MKTLTTATALAALLALPAFAQDVTPTERPPAATEEQKPPAVVEESADSEILKDESRPDTSQVPKFINQQAEEQVLASALIGASVYNPADENLGSINDIVFDKDGRVDAAILGVGGFLGIGAKAVAVSFEVIEQTTDADGNLKLVFDATSDELEAAPKYLTIAELKRQREMQEGAGEPQDAGLFPEPPATQ